MSDEARKEGFVPPPHINAEAHKRVMKWLKEASEEEIFQSAVEAGIYTADGKLTEPYRDSEEEVDQVTIRVPRKLVPAVEELLAKHAG